MSKVMPCNEVVAGCGFIARGKDDEDVLNCVAKHTREIHGMKGGERVRIRAAARHPREDEVRRPVDDAEDAVDVLGDERLAQHLHDGDGRADGGLEAQLDACRGGDREQVGALSCHELLVGGDHGLTGAQQLAHVAAGRIEPAHHLGHDVDAGVVTQRCEIVGKHVVVRHEVTVLRRIAHERPNHGQPVPGRALDLVAAFGEHPGDGRADRAVTEEAYADVNGRHAVSSTLSAI